MPYTRTPEKPGKCHLGPLFLKFNRWRFLCRPMVYVNSVEAKRHLMKE
jgi:hypothetical protein